QEGISTVVDESLLEQVIEQIDFAKIYLHFSSRLQASVINFLQRSKIPIYSIATADFSPDPLEIMQLPRAKSLTVHDMEPGFSDQQILELANRGFMHLDLSANLSHRATLQHFIEIAHSRRMLCASITVTIDYFHRFLDSIALREEGDQVLDVSDSSLPVLCFTMDSARPQYILETAIGYLFVSGDQCNRRIEINTEQKSGCLSHYLSHSMSLSRVCPGYALS
ncbi:hypothetical protein PFISCL1PPCAC_13168, partial [Pristionchus fissidentatus]